MAFIIILSWIQPWDEVQPFIESFLPLLLIVVVLCHGVSEVVTSIFVQLVFEAFLPPNQIAITIISGPGNCPRETESMFQQIFQGKVHGWGWSRSRKAKKRKLLRQKTTHQHHFQHVQPHMSTLNTSTATGFEQIFLQNEPDCYIFVIDSPNTSQTTLNHCRSLHIFRELQSVSWRGCRS